MLYNHPPMREWEVFASQAGFSKSPCKKLFGLPEVAYELGRSSVLNLSTFSIQIWTIKCEILKSHALRMGTETFFCDLQLQQSYYYVLEVD